MKAFSTDASEGRLLLCDSFKLKSFTKMALGNVIKQVPGRIRSEAKVFKAHLASKGGPPPPPKEKKQLIHYLPNIRLNQQ